MNNSILTTLKQTISAGMNRAAMTSCSRWTERVRVMGMPFPGMWSFDHHPWLREMHDSTCETNVGQKSAQMGYTETVLNKVFYNIDIRKVDCLYVLPTKTPDASDFSASRFDSALEMSDYLRNLFSDVKNVGHKRAGSVNLYIRGSQSRAGMKSVPAGFLVLDELDEMNQDNIVLVFERQSGQMEKEKWLISTPTIEEFGINKFFNASSQEHFFFPCPCCNRNIELSFPESLVIVGDDPEAADILRSHLICTSCKSVLPHELKTQFLKKGIWVPSTQLVGTRGFYINQLYSTTVKPHEIASAYLRCQTNPTDEQEFYNSKLGLTHMVKDARVTDTDLSNAYRPYDNGTLPNGSKIVTVGIDVGKYLHVVVIEWTVRSLGVDINYACDARIIDIEKVLNFEDLDAIFRKFNPKAVVIDANPERRKAFEVAQRYWGKIWLCFYGNNINGKYIHKGENELEQTVTVDRTSWLDMSLTRFMRKTVQIPGQAPHEFKEHVKSLVRVPGRDKNGNPTANYLNKGADHYGHALNYAEIALAIAANFNSSTNIR